MSGKMLVTTEAFGSIAQLRSREEAAASRISRRALPLVVKGSTQFEPHGGFFGIIGTMHPPEVYEEVAGDLSEEGIKIEVHRYKEQASRVPPEGMVPVAGEETHDVISVLSAVGGKAVEGAQLPIAGHVARIYPPEGTSELHNLSLA